MKIFLIGYMGSGKSTLGKPLAKKLGYRFLDTDQEIEREAGLEIPEIFKRYGEEEFRKMEREYLKKLDGEDDVVVSTGGGLPCFFDNMEAMNALGLTIYLRMGPGVLASRLMEGRQNRPLIAGKSREELESYIRENLERREAFYLKAAHTIEGIGICVDDIVHAIEN